MQREIYPQRSTSKFKPDFLRELKKETVQQLKEFEDFMQRSKSGNMAVHVDSEAQKRLEEAKSSLGMSERKQLFTHVEAEGIRNKIAHTKIELQNGKISQVQFDQQVMALLFQLQKADKLNETETSLLDKVKRSGSGLTEVSSGEVSQANSEMLTEKVNWQLEQ